MTVESTPPATTDTIRRVRTATGDEGWLATGYHQVRELFTDARLGRSHPDPESAARATNSAFFGGPMGNFETEPDDQLRMRAWLTPFFSPKRMRALRSKVEELTIQLLDELAAHGSPADLHTALALPLPILVICDLLGVPYRDRARFRAWTELATDVSDSAKVAEGIGELFGYCLSLVQAKRQDPADDVISGLCAKEGLSDQGAATLAMGLLFGGHESSVVEIGLGVLGLLANRGQWQALVEDPALIPNAVEEMLRAAPATQLPRYVRTDMEIGGVAVRTGDLVLLDLTAANHDSTVFPDPGRVDVTRDEGTHVTFGYGVRHCVGAPLARIELQAVYGLLTARFPTMRLAVDANTIPMRTHSSTGGVAELPVLW